MSSNALRYLLFPHTTLTENDYRNLSLLIPRMCLLQVLRPPFIPQWGLEQFCGLPVIGDEDQIEQVKLFLKGFQEFASLHGENSMMASLSHEWIAREAHESRFSIQSELKGKGEEQSKRNFLIEAAVFLEMARELDEHEAELEGNLLEVEGLEDEFRQILGIESGEDLDEDALKSLTPSLVSERTGLSFMLQKRIACWLRLLLNRMDQEADSPVFVALSHEVMEEVLDPIVAEHDRSGKPLEFVQTALCTLPSLERLTSEDFQALAQNLLASGLLADYRKKLEDFLRYPADSSLKEALTASSAAMKKNVEDFSKACGKPGSRQVSLTLTALQGCTLADLGRHFDKEGRQAWAKARLPKTTPIVFMDLG